MLGNDLCLVSVGIKYDRNKNTLMYCATKQPIGSMPEGYTNGTIIFSAFGSECNLMGFQVAKLCYLYSKPTFYSPQNRVHVRNWPAVRFRLYVASCQEDQQNRIIGIVLAVSVNCQILTETARVLSEAVHKVFWLTKGRRYRLFSE